MGAQTLASLTEYYNKLVSFYGPGLDSLQWNSKFSQTVRYDILVQHLPDHCNSICDAGCGTGDFYDYLCQKRLTYNYFGFDISANMIVAAQQAYAKGQFKCLAIDQLSHLRTFDVVVASGLFNIRVNQHEDYILEFIQRCLERAKIEVRFNRLSKKYLRRKGSSKFVYCDPDFMAKKLQKYVSKVEVIDGYLPNDVTFRLIK